MIIFWHTYVFGIYCTVILDVQNLLSAIPTNFFYRLGIFWTENMDISFVFFEYFEKSFFNVSGNLDKPTTSLLETWNREKIPRLTQ